MRSNVLFSSPYFCLRGLGFYFFSMLVAAVTKLLLWWEEKKIIREFIENMRGN